MLSGSGRFTLPYLPGGLRKTADPLRLGWVWRPFFDFFRFFSHAKKRLKFETSKNYFFSRFSRFLAPPASIFANSGAKMGPRRVDFRRFFEKPDFLKIELSMVIWPHFEGRTLSKLIPRACEKRLPCATAEKTEKNGRRD